MKSGFNSPRPVGRLSWCGPMLGAICATALFAGCSKPAQTTADSSSTQPTPVNSSSAPGAAPAAITNSATPDLVPLNQALMGWVMQHQRAPNNFDEFAASTDIKIPPPPPGKKYVINSHGLINLVNAK